MEKRSFHNPEYIREHKEKKRKQLLLRVSVVLGILVILIGGFAGLTQWKKLQIDMITVSGTTILSPQDIQNTTRQFISGNYFFIFAKNNALLYPRKGLQSFLVTQFPRINTITIGLQSYHTVNITLSERQPFALWCGSAPTLDDQSASSTPTLSSDCYFLDSTGFVFDRAPEFSGDAYFRYYGLVPYASAIGSTYLSEPGEFAQISKFETQVKSLNITPLYIVAIDDHDFELHLYGGGKIIFNDTDLAHTSDRLQLLLQKANLIPQKDGELLVQYIDLRFGDKVYYKVR